MIFTVLWHVFNDLKLQHMTEKISKVEQHQRNQHTTDSCKNKSVRHFQLNYRIHFKNQRNKMFYQENICHVILNYMILFVNNNK